MQLTTPNLSEDLLENYRSEGFAKIEGLLDSHELAILQEVIANDTQGGSQRVEVNSSVGQSYDYQESEEYQKMWSNVLNFRLVHEELRPLVKKIANYATELSGASGVRLLWDKTFSKPPAKSGTRQTVWHQDLPYLPVDRRGLLTFWIAVHDVTAEAGALRFIPKSHRLGPLGRADLIGEEPSYTDLLWSHEQPLVGEPTTMELTAGDATVHSGLTIHGAGENLSDKPRIGWALVFVPEDAKWTGIPHPHADFQGLGMEPGDTFYPAHFSPE